MSQKEAGFENLDFESMPENFEAREPYVNEDMDTPPMSEINVPEVDMPGMESMEIPEEDIPSFEPPLMEEPDAAAFQSVPENKEFSEKENLQTEMTEEAGGDAPLRVRLDESEPKAEVLPRIFFQSRIEEPPAAGPEEGSISREGVYIPIETVMDGEVLEGKEETEALPELLVLHEVVLRLAFLSSQYKKIKGMISDLENHVSMLVSIDSFASALQVQIEMLSEKGRLDMWKTSILSLRVTGPGQIQAEDPTSLLLWLAREETWLMRRFLPESMEKVGNAERGQLANLFADVLSACSMRRLALESFIEGLDKSALYMKPHETVWLCCHCHCLHRGTTPPEACRFCASPTTSFIEARCFSPYIVDREVFYAELEPQKMREADVAEPPAPSAPISVRIASPVPEGSALK